jgi:DinB superfamily
LVGVGSGDASGGHGSRDRLADAADPSGRRAEIQPYDQDAWAEALHYDKRDLTLALGAFAAARRANLEILRLLSEAEWERAYRHAEYGRLTLRQKIQHIADHDLAHLRQIRGE